MFSTLTVSLLISSVGICISDEFDIQGFIDNEVKNGNKRIVIQEGKYRITPKDQIHLKLANLDNIEIIADGVEMICTQTTRAISIFNCKNLTLRGLSIDYDPLPFTQGFITAISGEKEILDIELFDGYPNAYQGYNLAEIFAKESRTLRTGDKCFKNVTAIDNNHVRVFKCDSDPTSEERVGDIVALGITCSQIVNLAHAVTIMASVNVKLIDINLWASNCIGFYEHNSENTLYERCRIDRRPSSTDLVQRANPRIRSLNADAFHSVVAPIGPKLIDCTARFMGDDAVNIHGVYDLVTEKHDNTLRVLVKDDQPLVGAKYEIENYSGVRLDDAIVTKVEPDGQINDAEKQFLLDQHFVMGDWNPNAYKVTFDRNLEVGLGAVIVSTRRVGNGFAVKGCKFGWNRSRGIVIKASNGVVECNTLVGSRMPAVLISPEYKWLESGSSNNVNVKNNIIDQCLKTGINIEAYDRDDNFAPPGAHNNITVIGNYITNSPWPQILVTSTTNLEITNNKCSANSNHSTDPKVTPISFINSTMVKVQDKCTLTILDIITLIINNNNCPHNY